MAQIEAPRRRTRDPEYRALRKLARVTAGGVPDHPLDALHQVTDLAQELTKGRYAAVAVTDDKDYVEGFVVSGLTPEEERGHGPLGSMRHDGLAVRIDDLGQHGQAFGFPPKHPAMKTLLGVPIWVDGRVRGALYVTDRDGGKPFRADDEVVLQLLARHAGAVIADRWY
jgi:GAF domain-containing protein